MNPKYENRKTTLQVMWWEFSTKVEKSMAHEKSMGNWKNAAISRLVDAPAAS
jgi:hypothetical protein